MRFRSQESPKRFQQLVAELLELPHGCSDADVRKVLREKGPDYITWYDTRLRAIADSNQPKTLRNQKARAPRRVVPH